MAKAAKARMAALSVVGEARRRDARARDLLRSSPAMTALDGRDRALASRLVLGLVAARGLVQELVGGRLRAHAEPRVLDALHLAAYEALFLDTPTSVAVSQGVELVRGVRPRAAGMANAVLRRVVAEDLPRRRAACARVDEGSCGADDLAWASGYPAWLVSCVADDRGREAARALALAALLPAPVYVTANALARSDDEARELLQAAGLDPVDAGPAGSFALGRPSELARSGLVGNADVVVADLSACRVAELAGVRPGDDVLEVGQGRGTKTLLLERSALSRGGTARITGVDDTPFKVDVARRRMERAGAADLVRCVCLDARCLGGDPLPRELAREFDVALVDAPCSGTGTLRRHPEIAWSLGPRALDASRPDSLPALQLGLLAAAASRVRPGGRLCYATCSVLRCENEDVVAAFLSSPAGAGYRMEGEPFQSLPEQGGPDGHFCACLVRG